MEDSYNTMLLQLNFYTVDSIATMNMQSKYLFCHLQQAYLHLHINDAYSNSCSPASCRCPWCVRGLGRRWWCPHSTPPPGWPRPRSWSSPRRSPPPRSASPVDNNPIYLHRSKLVRYLLLRQHRELQDRVHELLCLLYPLDVAVHLVTLVTVNLLAPVTV